MDIRALYRAESLQEGMELRLSGWVRTVRDSKVFGFIELNDGSFFKNVQIVCEEGYTENFAQAMKLTVGSAIEIEGRLVLTPAMKQPFEIKATRVTVEGLADVSYPLQKKRHTLEYLRSIAHLRPRSNTFSAVFRVRSLAAQLIHRYFQEHNFIYVHTPIITSSDAEGAGEMFQVTTLDMNKLPRTAEGLVDSSKDF